MHRLLFVLPLFCCAALLQAQPTPRPGRPLAAPVLLPRDGASASAQGKKMQGRNLDSTVMPAEKSPLALPLATHVPEDAVQAPAVNEPVKKPVEETIEWLSIEEAVEKNKLAPRKILVDVYTDWCGWCKRMMATTYADENVAAYINRNFYPVKFDAEGKDTVMFQGKKYSPVSNAPRTTHPLAAELLQGNMMYPTTLFMNNYNADKPEFAFKLLVPGYLDQKKLEPFLVYTLENVYRTTQAEDFNRTFELAFFDTTINALLKEIPWKQTLEVFDGNFQSDKKRLVFIHTNWCNSCRVMERGVFTDSLLQNELDSFVVVDFNPEIQDPLFWNNTLYQRKTNDNFPFHPLSLDLTRRNFVLPSIVLLDEREAIIDAIPFYLPPELLKDILLFYGRDIYKQKSWADF